VSSIEVVFFADAVDLPKFGGMVPDLTEERGFFLREGTE
jgi:hypothetical protein